MNSYGSCLATYCCLATNWRIFCINLAKLIHFDVVIEAHIHVELFVSNNVFQLLTKKKVCAFAIAFDEM